MRFRLRAQTNNSMNQPHNSWYYHSPELAETGKHISADISVNATAYDMQVKQHNTTHLRSVMLPSNALCNFPPRVTH